MHVIAGVLEVCILAALKLGRYAIGIVAILRFNRRGAAYGLGHLSGRAQVISRVEVIRWRSGGKVDLSMRKELLAVRKTARSIALLAPLRATPNPLTSGDNFGTN